MKRQERSPVLFSLIAHVVIGAGLLQLLSMHTPLRRWLEDETDDVKVERIGFISLPVSPVPTAGKRGGDGRPATEHPPVRRPVPALPSPNAVTPAESPTHPTPAIEEEGGSGPIIGGGGDLRGVQPSFHDPRLWTIPDQIVTAPKSASERLDSAVAERIAAVTDSIAQSGPRKAAPDWTIERDGKKYGLDGGGLHLGGITIPMIPFIPPLGRIEETRRAYAIRSEILQQSQRRMNEDEFRQAAQRIRERKDRERQEKRQQQHPEKEIAAPVGSSDR
jgi:hypothetical protein